MRFPYHISFTHSLCYQPLSHFVFYISTPSLLNPFCQKKYCYKAGTEVQVFSLKTIIHRSEKHYADTWEKKTSKVLPSYELK